MAGQLYLGSEKVMPVLTVGVSSPVKSVNGKTGNVVLNANDVHALPSSTVIPTVNNPTITFTQGGVSKGSITLNQSEDETISLDAGGGDPLPSQTGNSGKFLTTDGSSASWATVNALPSQAGNNGKFLTTNGSSSSWKTLEFIDISGSSDVDVVAANISDVINASENMASIQAAPTAAENAEKWAEGSDADVSPLGGTHSSKGWATQAQNYAISASSSSQFASDRASEAASSALSAASSASQALLNSQKILKSINKADAWTRSYTDYETEKSYQFITCNQVSNDLVVSISDTVSTTQEEIQANGILANGYEGNSSLIIIGNAGYMSYYNGTVGLLGKHGSVIYTTEPKTLLISDSGNASRYNEFLNKDGTLYSQYYSSYDNITAPQGTYSSGWTMAFYPRAVNSQLLYGFGIREGKLYSILNTSTSSYVDLAYYTATLLDESGQWTYATGTYKGSNNTGAGLGIKDGKLYTMTNSTVTLLDDTRTWTAEILYHKMAGLPFEITSSAVYVINSGELLAIKSTGVTSIANNMIFIAVSNNYAVSNDGKLYMIGTTQSGYVLNQVGTDTDWTKDILICGYPKRVVAIKSDGNIYYGNPASTLTQLTFSGGYTGIAGGVGYGSAINTMVAWKQTPILKYETAYTTPTSTTGNYLYMSTSLADPKTITAIDSSSVTAGGYIYTRDSSKDTYFVGRPDTFVSRALTTGDIVDALS